MNWQSVSRPPYLLGLLCLIPLVGAFVGLALILYGILKYKDKFLVLIGAGGIVITIAVYSFLAYYAKFGESANRGFASLTQTQINKLVNNIEFYKFRKGAYPDSLRQLRQIDKTIVITDIMLRNTDTGALSNYHYKKTGSNYLVFSVGIDGLANTKDDIYPVVDKADTSSFGFIKKN